MTIRDAARARSSLASLTLTLALAAGACSPQEESAADEQSGNTVATVASLSQVPLCNPSQSLHVYYVSSEKKFYYCDGSGLRPIDVVGQPGANGTSWLAALGPAANGACAAGGTVLKIGPDADRDGVLDDVEVAAATTVCNGVNGKDGSSCHARDNGDGTKTIWCDDGTVVKVSDGAAGQPPAGALIQTHSEPKGTHCAEGGVRIDTGIDLDRDGVLDADEVTDTQYVCNGAAGGTGRALGASCASAADCTSGFCSDAVCCDASCAGACQACNLPGSVGVCSFVGAGDDPADECAGALSCNGAGACAASAAANGAPCATNSACLSGMCADGVCCSTACTGSCQACTAGKTGSSDGTCAPILAGTDPDNECNNSSCDGSGHCSLLPQGSTCASASDCATGFCVDGFCCDSACNGLCRSCSGSWTSTGVDGVCGLIECGDPQNECAGASLCDFGTCHSQCL